LPLTEKALIARVRRQAHSGYGVVAGIGDDCAVLRLPRGHEALITTDFSLEGVHFRRAWHPPESVGHRCLARGLSDIAAMGGRPLAAFLSLALPRRLPQAWVEGFMRGFLKLARKFHVSLAGGDTAESLSGILADIVVLGSVPRGQAILRAGARPGHLLYVTGELGASAATVHRMMARPNRKLQPRDYPRHFFPEPRLEIGRRLRQRGLASAMIDLSDGLSTDLAHICEESGVGAEVESALIPRAVLGRPRQRVSLEDALHGGEDYELLFAVPPGKPVPARVAGIAVTRVGRITRGKALELIDHAGSRRELRPQGWEHFTRPS
jgi:thiamine-monophosphate kinase